MVHTKYNYYLSNKSYYLSRAFLRATSFLFNSFIAGKKYSMCISVYNIENNGTLEKVSLVSKTGTILSVYQCVMTKSEPTVKCCISVLMPYSVSKFGIYGFTIWFKKHMMIRVITEHRAIFQRKGKTHKSTNRQNQSTTENWENRNGPDNGKTDNTMAKRRKKTKSHSMIQKQLQINSRVTSYAP
jgi:hypothetical protein